MPASLQIAQQAKTGKWLLRPVWRAIYWGLTEMPARLEAVLPPPTVVPVSSTKLKQDQTQSSGQCAWAPVAATNSSAVAASMHVSMTGSADSAYQLHTRLASS